MSNMALHLQDIHRTFIQGDKKLHVLRGCSLQLQRGEKIALIAPSGGGKSTLLHIAGLLEKQDQGSILVAGEKADHMDDAARTALRRTSIGFVYQYHHLLPEFSARENIIIPQMIAGQNKSTAATRADALLALIGLSDRAAHRPAQLSGGEQQRIAIARALANKPHLLIADEPTGNLDPDTAHHVFTILKNVVENEGTGLLMATHNLDLAQKMDRVYRLKDGLIIE